MNVQRVCRDPLFWFASRALNLTNKKDARGGIPGSFTLRMTTVNEGNHPVKWSAFDYIFSAITNILIIVIVAAVSLATLGTLTYQFLGDPAGFLVATTMFLILITMFFRLSPGAYLSKIPTRVIREDLCTTDRGVVWLLYSHERWKSVRNLIANGISPKEFQVMMETLPDHRPVVELMKGRNHGDRG